MFVTFKSSYSNTKTVSKPWYKQKMYTQRESVRVSSAIGKKDWSDIKNSNYKFQRKKKFSNFPLSCCSFLQILPCFSRFSLTFFKKTPISKIIHILWPLGTLISVINWNDSLRPKQGDAVIVVVQTPLHWQHLASIHLIFLYPPQPN